MFFFLGAAGNFMAVRKKNKNQGFSLIELSIALAVFGLIMGGALSRYESYMKQKDYLTTLGRSASIRVAMERFVTENGRFPCPAGPALSYSDPNAGVENCSTMARQRHKNSDGLWR
jgi:prepilin-type N-terminal cleavage/methylation domain-containing protein